MEQALREEGVARSHHVVHVLPSGDHRVATIIGAQLDRVTPGGPVRLLVLVPGDAAALHLARLANAREAVGAHLFPASQSPRALRRMALGVGAIAATPAMAVALIRQSALKLDAVECVVLVELDALLAQDAASLQAITPELARGIDRIAVTATTPDSLATFLDGFAARARHVTYGEAPTVPGLSFVVCDRSARPAVMEALLDQFDPPHATIVAGPEARDDARLALARLGYGAGDAMVALADSADGEAETAIWFDAPSSVESVTHAAAATASRRIVLVAPEDAAGFIRLTGGTAMPIELPTTVRAAHSADNAFRAAVRAALGEPGLHRELLSLAPLFGEHDPALVAAALARLAERRAPDREARPGTRAEPMPRAQPRGAPVAVAGADGGLIRLFISSGSRDGITKGDLVGAITGEAGIAADQIGKIELRISHAVVEVGAGVAGRVIENLTGKTIRGRVVAVREDRVERQERPEGRATGARPGRPVEGRGREGRSGPRRDGAGGRDDRRGGGREERGPRRSFGQAAGSERPRRSGGHPGAGADRPRRDRPEPGTGPRGMRDDRSARGPRAIRESEEWSKRGDRLRNARRPRRGEGTG